MLLVIVAMGIFLIGAMGLAIDVSQLYAHQQMAQVAADAAAQAAMLSIFQGVNNSTSNPNTYFPTNASFQCTTGTDKRTPCRYARMNGFGINASDTVTVAFPACGVGCAYSGIIASGTPNQVQVTITRAVPNSIIRMVGASALSTVAATAIAANLNVVSPTPILITDPQNANTLSMNGTTSIAICGGPTRSIQVNSTANGYTGGGAVDLSHAGPVDPGNCTTGTGGDFGTFGGPGTNPGVLLGSTGHYNYPASPIPDPLADVPAPAVPAAPAAGTGGVTIMSPTDGCTSTCTEYSPGLYKGGLNLKNNAVIFKPGLYYMQGGGFTMKNVVGGGSPTFNGLTSGMCTGCAPDPNTGTGMVVYDTGPAGSTASGGFHMDTGVSIFLRGSALTTTNAHGDTVPAAPYYGVLFWEDRAADQNLSHNLGTGNASFAWEGTIYITNTLAIMQNTTDPLYPNHVQAVTYNGGPSGNTIMKGYFIVSRLSLVGNTLFRMQLIPFGYMQMSQVALVGGGPKP